MPDLDLEHTTPHGDTLNVFVSDGTMHLGIQEVFYCSIAIEIDDAFWLMGALQQAMDMAGWVKEGPDAIERKAPHG